ncbi:MAG: hypothetical protein ABL931_03520 [Usitatibacteraceae bacterium]
MSLTEKLVAYIADNDISVRNGIGQCLNRAVQFQDNSLRFRIIDAAFEQLDLPNHSDRNKAIATIQAAMSGNQMVRKYIREKYLHKLERIARTSVLPNVGGTATVIVRSLNAAKSID